MTTSKLIECIREVDNFKKMNQTTHKNFFEGCGSKISDAINEEFLKRFLAPIFILIIGLTSSLVITSTKDQKNYRMKNFLKFFFGVVIIVVSEVILSSSVKNLNQMIAYFLIPFFIFTSMYFYIFINYKFLKKD